MSETWRKRSQSVGLFLEAKERGGAFGSVCPRRQCRGFVQHNRLRHWLGWVLR